MNVRYRILFSINVLHDYYTNLKCTDISFVPAKDTLVKMQAGQMLYKVLGNTLVVLIKVDDNDKPYVELDEAMKLRFYLEVLNHGFVTKTNINLDELRNKRLYFNNLTENKVGSTLYLSEKIPAYDGAKDYVYSEMANAGGTIFECIKTPAAGNGTDKDDYWYPRGTTQYLSTGDMIVLSTGVRNYMLSVASKVFDIQVNGLNTATNTYDKVVKSIVQTTDTATKEVQVDLRELQSGKHIVNINGEGFTQYIDAQAAFSNTIGMIDIFNHLDGANDFALLDASGKTKEHTYTIHFANRLAQWKYLTTKKGVKNITDNAGIYEFLQKPDAPATAEYFESNKPIPLQQSPLVFELELNAPLSEPPPAPNPNPDDGSMLIRKGDLYVCKIYLNY